jgi:hypothetical protein
MFNISPKLCNSDEKKMKLKGRNSFIILFNVSFNFRSTIIYIFQVGYNRQVPPAPFLPSTFNNQANPLFCYFYSKYWLLRMLGIWESLHLLGINIFSTNQLNIYLFITFPRVCFEIFIYSFGIFPSRWAFASSAKPAHRPMRVPNRRRCGDSIGCNRSGYRWC